MILTDTLNRRFARKSIFNNLTSEKFLYFLPDNFAVRRIGQNSAVLGKGSGEKTFFRRKRVFPGKLPDKIDFRGLGKNNIDKKSKKHYT